MYQASYQAELQRLQSISSAAASDPVGKKGPQAPSPTPAATVGLVAAAAAAAASEVPSIAPQPRRGSSSREACYYGIDLDTALVFTRNPSDGSLHEASAEDLMRIFPRAGEEPQGDSAPRYVRSGSDEGMHRFSRSGSDASLGSRHGPDIFRCSDAICEETVSSSMAAYLRSGDGTSRAGSKGSSASSSPNKISPTKSVSSPELRLGSKLDAMAAAARWRLASPNCPGPGPSRSLSREFLGHRPTGHMGASNRARSQGFFTSATLCNAGSEELCILSQGSVIGIKSAGLESPR